MRNVPSNRYAVVTLLALTAGVAHAGTNAQSWVSNTGSDKYPCTLTQPCATFSAAINATIAGGEVDVLNAGDYGIGLGTVNISSSITIDGGNLAHVTGGPGDKFVVFPGGGTVVLRNMSITSEGAGGNPISFQGAGSLYIENVSISAVGGQGLVIGATGAADIRVTNSSIMASEGVYIAAVSRITPPPIIHLETVAINVSQLAGVGGGGNGAFAFSAFGSATASLRNVEITASASQGNAYGVLASTSTSVISLENCSIHNVGQAVVSSGVVRLSNTSIHDNFLGLDTISGGHIVSFGNNQVAGNTTDGAPTSTVTMK
jgi:hypothetical protein